MHERREEIQLGNYVGRHPARRNAVGPPHDPRDAHASFPCRTLGAPQQAGPPDVPKCLSFLEAPCGCVRPRAVVAEKDCDRVSIQVRGFESVENLPDTPVDFFDRVAVPPSARAALEARGHAERKVRHVVGDVEEEGPAARLADEAKSLLRVPLRQSVRIDWPFDLLQAAVQRNGRCVLHERQPIVMRVRQSEKIIESVRRGIEFRPARKIAKVPLAEHPGPIALRLQRLRDRDLLLREADRRAGTCRLQLAGSHRVAAGQELRPRRRTEGAA